MRQRICINTSMMGWCSVNVRFGYPLIDIRSPLEFLTI